MTRKRALAPVAAVAVMLSTICGWPQSTRAEAQTRPYVLTIVDTSGSMGEYGGEPLRQVKGALRDIVDSTGDLIFGLQRFGQDCQEEAACTCVDRHCQAEAPVVGFAEDSSIEVRKWVDEVCEFDAANPELVIPELVAPYHEVATPLAASLQEARAYFSSQVIPNDGKRGCRPYYVILLTDGLESCHGDPVAAVQALRSIPVDGQTFEVKTYIVGYRFQGDPTQLDAMAVAGGTGRTRAIYTQDRASVSLALSQVISESLARELCNGKDDDCDGLVDEDFPDLGRPCNNGQLGACLRSGKRVCGSDQRATVCDAPQVTPGTEVCNSIDDNCNGAVDEGGVCQGCIPTPEVCDGQDNNCNQLVDENIPAVPCGSSIGECKPGHTECIDGAPQCRGASGPQPETCDGKDNNCDGVVDQFTQPCYPAGNGCDLGSGQCNPPCQLGLQLCSGGAWGACQGYVGPQEETCNSVDDDCDGVVDNLPNAGQPCGSDVGECQAGTVKCDGGVLTCVGAVGPQTEVCDGKDNDCDGVVDNDVPVGQPCGTNVGACQMGVSACKDGHLDCTGGVGPTAETCNGVDDDCNGRIDDQVPGDGDPCGSDIGECREGVQRCVNGSLGCFGDQKATSEVCDCRDNDCDGTVDNGDLCPTGSKCIECICATPCKPGTEFACSGGRECRDGYCLPGSCGGSVCHWPEICRDDKCVDPCDGVTCPPGKSCALGSCVDCNVEGCPSAYLCRGGQCVPDPCTGLVCAPGQACREGACVASCADILCDLGQRCHDGTCIGDACADVDCGQSGQVCRDGGCVDDPCLSVSCPRGRVCQQGACVEDPCVPLHCPPGEHCAAGECLGGELPARELVTTTGGGGCQCHVGGASGASTAGGAAGWPGLGPWLLLAIFGLLRVGWWWLRRIGPLALLLLAVSLVLAAAGCQSNPICANCTPPAMDGGALPGDGGVDREAGGGDRCVPGEGRSCPACAADLMTDPLNCGRCGYRCELRNAFPACIGGKCQIASCEQNAWDINGKPEDGCEYVCTKTNGGIEICDGLDNNCNQEIDEGFDTKVDVQNCGRCGNICVFTKAVAGCTAGECYIARCEPGYWDADGKSETGCEYLCTKSSGGVEICDGVDNDCNGVIDDVAGSGVACGRNKGECRPGEMRCVGSELACVGATEPTVETCDGKDNDCDGVVDNGFDLEKDPRNCGACGKLCSFAHAKATCLGGHCAIASCDANYFDANLDSNDGCECLYHGQEICNGVDDDCDGKVDEADPDLTRPDLTRACQTQGECASVQLKCLGAAGWTCVYPPTVELDQSGKPLPVETRCDDRDNNCDGRIDEPWPDKGSQCDDGKLGICRGLGSFVCRQNHQGLRCLITQQGQAKAVEACNGLDDDCDGKVDEPEDDAAGPGTPDELIHVQLEESSPWGEMDFSIHTYEASRPDASATSPGALRNRACSRAGVMPWGDATWLEADAACRAAGMRLCTAAEWQAACQSADRYVYPYGNTYQPLTCNGADHDIDPNQPGLQHGPLATGAMAQCQSPFKVFDLSGNLKEWTATAVEPDVYAIRGGAFNNISPGLRCDFDFTVASSTFYYPSVGFRCCQ